MSTVTYNYKAAGHPTSRSDANTPSDDVSLVDNAEREVLWRQSTTMDGDGTPTNDVETSVIVNGEYLGVPVMRRSSRSECMEHASPISRPASIAQAGITPYNLTILQSYNLHFLRC